MYILIWNNEVIDKAEDMETAIYLKREYEMAYGSSVNIVKQ